MSTNASISIKRIDGTTTGIYLHWDGYIDSAGVILQLNYNTAEKVEKLLALGDLSSLGKYLEPMDPNHNFDHPEPDVCVAYHRDSGEEFAQHDQKQEYNYIFDEYTGCWYVECEEFITQTPAMDLLNINFMLSYRRSMLLDKIEECYNLDDNIIELCRQQALSGCTTDTEQYSRAIR